tara:strand:+ start:3103 stop:4101 length:999 start_codon:yes stop_codon:yes gene_type:complete
MANPITAIASRSCAKNSLLKQTTGEEKDDLSSGSSTTEVSTTANVPIATASGSDIYGSKTDTTVTTPDAPPTTETKTRPTYREAWEQDLEGVRTGGGYTDVDDYITKREAAKALDPEGTEAAIAAATGVSGGPGTVTITTPGTQGDSDTDSKTTPEYETAKGMSGIGTRRDFRRQKIAERLSGKSEKQARRYAKRAARLNKRGKTEKAGIFETKSELASDRAENLRDRLDQFRTQQDQGGSGRSSYQTTKVRENIDAAKERLTDNSKSFAGNDPTDFQQVGKNVAKIAKDIKEKGLGAAQDVGNFLGRKKPLTGMALKTGPVSGLKSNYFNK